VAAADDFAARLLRLDQGVEAVLDAVKRWPQTPILQLYTAAFWLYGQTGEALANAASHLKACAALTLNAREQRASPGARALARQRQLARRRRHGGDHRRVAG
jgi:hypothetical protein